MTHSPAPAPGAEPLTQLTHPWKGQTVVAMHRAQADKHTLWTHLHSTDSLHNVFCLPSSLFPLRPFPCVPTGICVPHPIPAPILVQVSPWPTVSAVAKPRGLELDPFEPKQSKGEPSFRHLLNKNIVSTIR